MKTDSSKEIKEFCRRKEGASSTGFPKITRASLGRRMVARGRASEGGKIGTSYEIPHLRMGGPGLWKGRTRGNGSLGGKGKEGKARDRGKNNNFKCRKGLSNKNSPKGRAWKNVPRSKRDSTGG